MILQDEMIARKKPVVWGLNQTAGEAQYRTYISRLEQGVRNPSLLTVEKIAKALGVKATTLIEYE